MSRADEIERLGEAAVLLYMLISPCPRGDAVRNLLTAAGELAAVSRETEQS